MQIVHAAGVTLQTFNNVPSHFHTEPCGPPAKNFSSRLTVRAGPSTSMPALTQVIHTCIWSSADPIYMPFTIVMFRADCIGGSGEGPIQQAVPLCEAAACRELPPAEFYCSCRAQWCQGMPS